MAVAVGRFCAGCGADFDPLQRVCRFCGGAIGGTDPSVSHMHRAVIRDYRPAWGHALVAQALYVVLALVAIGGIASRGFERHLLLRLTDDPGSVTLEQALDSDRRIEAITTFEVALGILAGVALIVWLYRAYRNVTALGSTPLRRQPFWAIAGWFVPVWNLWVPKQIVNDVWRGSDPGHLGADPKWARNRDVPGLLLAWWIGPAVFWVVAFIVAGSVVDLTTIDGTLRANLVGMGFQLMILISAVLSFQVVSRVTDRQRLRARLLA
jgi:hypothetical protein